MRASTGPGHRWHPVPLSSAPLGVLPVVQIPGISELAVVPHPLSQSASATYFRTSSLTMYVGMPLDTSKSPASNSAQEPLTSQGYLAMFRDLLFC